MEVPPPVVTVICTIPEPAGATAIIEVSLTSLKEVAGTFPNETPVAPVNPEPVRVTFVSAGPDDGEIKVIVLDVTPLKASPLVSTVAQKLAEEQDTDVSVGLLSPGIEVEFQVVPFHDDAFPWLSTTTQKVVVGQEIEVGEPISTVCEFISSGFDHFEPSQVKKYLFESVAAQNVGEAQDTDANPPLSIEDPSLQVPELKVK